MALREINDDTMLAGRDESVESDWGAKPRESARIVNFQFNKDFISELFFGVWTGGRDFCPAPG